MKEPAFRRLPALIETLAEAIGPLAETEYAFFGHSMGALIAFELARELRRRKHNQPQRIFVSGRGAPQIRHTDPITYNLPEPEFIRELEKLNGTPREVLAHAELMQLMIPLLRTDFELVETYDYKDEAPLDCPITVYGGILDLEVPRDALLRWKEQTTAECKVHVLFGDHFFLRSAERELLALLSRELLEMTVGAVSPL